MNRLRWYSGQFQIYMTEHDMEKIRAVFTLVIELGIMMLCYLWWRSSIG